MTTHIPSLTAPGIAAAAAAAAAAKEMLFDKRKMHPTDQPLSKRTPCFIEIHCYRPTDQNTHPTKRFACDFLFGEMSSAKLI